MNLQESIRKDLNLLSEAPDYEPLGFEIPKQEPQKTEKKPTLVVDREEFVDYCAEHISDSIQLQGNDLALEIAEQIMDHGDWGMHIEEKDLIYNIKDLPLDMVKNRAQIQREFPELWERIKDNNGMVPNPQTMIIDIK